MGLRLIRQKSDPPNVQNTDDVRMVRYAYGGYDGVVKNKGTECSYTTSGTTFKINSGVLVLQGWETEIDGNGWEMSIDSLTKYYAVYLEVNLATDTAAIKSVYDTAGVPSVISTDDLTQTTNGTARMTLYTFKSSGSVISEVSKKIRTIEYSSSFASRYFTEDENGILRYKDTIVPQKKQVWSGRFEKDPHVESFSNLELNSPLRANDKIEIVYHEEVDFLGQTIIRENKSIFGIVSQNGVDGSSSLLNVTPEVYLSRAERRIWVTQWKISLGEDYRTLSFGAEYTWYVSDVGDNNNYITTAAGTTYVVTKIYKIIG